MPAFKMEWKRKGKDRYVCGAYEVRTNYCTDAEGNKYVLNFDLYAQDTYIRSFEVCGEAKAWARDMERIEEAKHGSATV